MAIDEFSKKKSIYDSTFYRQPDVLRLSIQMNIIIFIEHFFQSANIKTKHKPLKT